MRWIVAILALLPVSAGYSAEWTRELAEAHRLCDENLHEQAEALYLSALAKAESQDTTGLFAATVLNDLGYCFHGAGRLLEAEKFYLRSLALLEKGEAANYPRKLRVASNLVRLYLETGQTSRSERVLRRFLPSESSSGPRLAEEAILWADLGFVLTQYRQYAQAERVLQAAIATLQAADLHEHAVIALSNLSILYVQTGKLASAVAQSQRARDLLTSIPNVSDATVIKTISNAAVLAVFEGDLEQAELWFQEAVTLAESKLPPGHPLLGHVLDTYAQFLRQTMRQKEAGELAARAAAILSDFQRENLMGLTVEARSLVRQGSTPAGQP